MSSWTKLWPFPQRPENELDPNEQTITANKVVTSEIVNVLNHVHNDDVVTTEEVNEWIEDGNEDCYEILSDNDIIDLVMNEPDEDESQR